MVQIVGGGYDQFDGLPIWSPGNVVRGLAFCGLRGSIKLYGTDAHDNSITGPLIGACASGARAVPKRVPDWGSGVRLSGGASNNVIGGTSPAERNVIFGNANEGIEISHGRSTYGFPPANQVTGNVIGTDLSGERGPKVRAQRPQRRAHPGRRQSQRGQR